MSERDEEGRATDAIGVGAFFFLSPSAASQAGLMGDRLGAALTRSARAASMKAAKGQAMVGWRAFFLENEERGAPLFFFHLSQPHQPLVVSLISTPAARVLAAARAEDAAACLAAATALSKLAGPGPPPPALSTWRTVFSTSPGASGGRVGPFRGETTQVFHASPSTTAGTYTNKLAFGGSLAVLELSGTWEAVRADRVNVVFLDTKWSVLGGLLKGGSTFPPDKQPRGHWSLLYGDDAVRVFTTNKGSLFVLERV